MDVSQLQVWLSPYMTIKEVSPAADLVKDLAALYM